MFHTPLGLHLHFFENQNSCSTTWLLDPFASANFESPSDAYCCANIKFPWFLGIRSNLSPYNLNYLNLRLLFAKKFKNLNLP
jgi:hypothetical protein